MRAAQTAQKKGLTVALIESKQIGGVCLNIGCIPTKSLLYSTSILAIAKQAGHHGVSVTQADGSLDVLQNRQRSVVGTIRDSVERSLRESGIEIIKGAARFLSGNEIDAGHEKVCAKDVIIATGSSARRLEGFATDAHILYPDDIFNLSHVPDSLLIVGAGAIGCEFAGFFNAMGSRVTVLEIQETILPLLDLDLTKRLAISFRKKGIGIVTGAALEHIEREGEHIRVLYSTGSGDVFSDILVSAGRQPNTDLLHLEKAGVKIRDGGWVDVDSQYRTSADHIWAIGDCIGRRLVAHAAEREGEIVVGILCGEPESLDYSLIPEVVYTSPEVAAVGMKESGIDDIGTYGALKGRFGSVAKAHILNEVDGIFKIIYQKDSGTIVGAHMYGYGVSELISFFSLAIHKETTLKELKKIVFPHPTLSEAIHQAVGDIS
ncbi:MAG: NAD(P)/FAD-dependent oxidoreductase [Candidatus Omnitrophica bacterium]|nr:NAD(P)/FAD-dependent oxidoreductase [Candidatus Omnitrophota bacterium]